MPCAVLCCTRYCTPLPPSLQREGEQGSCFLLRFGNPRTVAHSLRAFGIFRPAHRARTLKNVVAVPVSTRRLGPLHPLNAQRAMTSAETPTETTDILVPLDTDKQPIIWDGNDATMDGLLITWPSTITWSGHVIPAR